MLPLLDQLHQTKRLHGGSKKTMVAAWDTLLAWQVSDSLYPDGLDKAGFQNQTPAVLPTKLKGDGPAPEHPAFAAIAELITFSQTLPSAEADLLRHATVWVARRLETEKQKRSEMGFDDLLTRLDGRPRRPPG